MSLDPHYYNKYSYDVVVHPDGVLKGAGAHLPVGQSLKPLLMNTPNNFRQFPRQKYYFELEKITTGSLGMFNLLGDASNTPVTIGILAKNEFFLELNVAGQYSYNNFQGAAVLSNTSVPKIKACNAMVPIQFTMNSNNDGNGETPIHTTISNKFVPSYRASIQIPNIFNQELRFRIMYKSLEPVATDATNHGDPQSYNYNLQEYKPTAPVALSFSICVNKTYGNDGEFN